jgi:hypothetical protein
MSALGTLSRQNTMTLPVFSTCPYLIITSLNVLHNGPQAGRTQFILWLQSRVHQSARKKWMVFSATFLLMLPLEANPSPNDLIVYSFIMGLELQPGKPQKWDMHTNMKWKMVPTIQYWCVEPCPCPALIMAKLMDLVRTAVLCVGPSITSIAHQSSHGTEFWMW